MHMQHLISHISSDMLCTLYEFVSCLILYVKCDSNNLYHIFVSNVICHYTNKYFASHDAIYINSKPNVLKECID